MGSKPIDTQPAARFSVDGMIAASVLIAVALVVGSLWPVPRTPVSGADLMRADLQILTPNERLLVFEDYGAGPGLWENAERVVGSARLGSVIRPLSDAPLTRRIDAAPGTGPVTVVFEVVATPGTEWADPIIDGAEITTGRDMISTTRTRVWLVAEAGADGMMLTVPHGGVENWALDNLIVVASQESATE